MQELYENVELGANGQAVIMCTSNPMTGDSCNLVIQKSAFSYDDYDMGEMLSTYKDQIATSLTASGYQNVTADTATTTVMGKSEACIDFSAEYLGTKIYERCVCLAKGNYLMVITVASTDQSNFDSVYSCFSTIN